MWVVIELERNGKVVDRKAGYPELIASHIADAVEEWVKAERSGELCVRRYVAGRPRGN